MSGYWSRVIVTGAAWLGVLAGVCPVVVGEPAGTAHSDAVDGESLATRALKAKSAFEPLPPDHVSQARARLQRAVDRLDAVLSTTTAENTANWKEYLRWDDMLSEVKKSSGPNVRQLERILARYYRNHDSLEHPAFLRMRQALLDYRNAIVMAEDDQLSEHYRSRLEKLAEELRKYKRNPTVELGRSIGGLVRWLERARQADGLVAAIRERYWHPNLYASISEGLAEARGGMDIEETDDVRDCILGTLMFSQSTMRGQTGVDFVDSARSAHIELSVNGVTDSDNVGYNRGVRIFSVSETTVDATKTIHLGKHGLDFQRSQVDCVTESTLTGVAAPSGLVARLAKRRAYKTQPQAETVASRHAESRMRRRIDGRADKLLKKAQHRYQERFRKPLLRRGEFPQELKFRTADERLRVVWCQANPSQLAASAQPRSVEEEHDLSVQVHESFVSNFSRAMLGGLRVTDETLVELLKENDLNVPEAMRLSADKEPWAITFSAREPVNASFSDQQVRFAIRGRRFELGDHVVRKAMEMSAVYTLKKTSDGAHLTRQGDVTVDYLRTDGRLSAEEVVVRTVMRRKFEAVFPPEFETAGIKLPGERARGGRLRLQALSAGDHWLNLAWIKSDSVP